MLPLFALLVLGIGCGPKVTSIGPGHIYEPKEDERRLWVATAAMSSSLQSSGALYEDQKLQIYINSVLKKIIGEHGNAYVPLDPQVFVIDSPTINAFAFPHGHIFVHTGFLGRIRTEAQLAMVLGHEITHATHRHTYQVREQAYDASGALAYISVLSAVGGENVFKLTNRLGTVITLAAIAGYGRSREEQADEVGLALLAQAGYNPSEGATMFQRMMDAADPKAKRGVFLYASHPKMKNRIRSCERLVPRIPPELLDKAMDVGQDRSLDVAIALIHDEVERHIVQGKFQLAEETLATLEETRSGDSRTFALRGDLCRVRASDGDLELAKSSYKKAIERSPRESTAFRGLGFLMLKSGNKAEARKYLESYLSTNPNAPDADYVRSSLKRLAGD